jgi:transcription initiation factor TFIID subunit 8
VKDEGMAAKASKDREKGSKKSLPSGPGTGSSGVNSASGGSAGGGGNSGGSIDAFGRSVAKLAVAQVCEATGFHALQQSAVETLADIALRYLGDLGKAAHSYANLSGRTQCNALDVILGIEDLGSGLAGAAETSRCVANSAALRDVMRYVEYAEEIPFARPVPHFPVFKKRAPTPSFAQLGETPPHPHIPSWLPAFPDPHTYCHTPVWNERKSDPRLDKLEQARQRRKAERSLVSLHLRLSGRGAVVSDGSNNNLLNLVVTSGGDSQPYSRQQWPSQDVSSVKTAPEAHGSKGKGKRPAAHHPFLAPPLSAGEKEVTLVTPFRGTTELHAQNQDSHGPAALPSVLEAFAPALEAVKKGFEVVDSGSRPLKEKQQTFIAETKDRMPVSLTFDWGQKTRAKALAAKRCLAQPVSPPSNKRARGNASSWKEEEKDEKSKRAEQILAQAMEESEEVAQ